MKCIVSVLSENIIFSIRFPDTLDKQMLPMSPSFFIKSLKSGISFEILDNCKIPVEMTLAACFIFLKLLIYI